MEIDSNDDTDLQIRLPKPNNANSKDAFQETYL